jgi:hypothetical protein
MRRRPKQTEFSCQKTKGASPSARKAQKRPAPFVSLIELVLRFWERESAPAGSNLASQIIGEPVFGRFRAADGIHAAERSGA